MNRGSGIKLLAVILLLAAGVYFSIGPIKDGAKLGLDTGRCSCST